MASSKKEAIFVKHSSSSWAVRRDIPLAILAWLSLIFISFWLLGHISRSVLIFVIAAILAFALVPAVRFLEHFLPRLFAILVVYLVVLSGLGILFYIVISAATHQSLMLAHNMRVLLTPVGHNTSSPLVLTLKSFGITQPQLTEASKQLTAYAESLTHSIIPFLKSIFTSLLDTLIVAVLSIYLLLDGEKFFMWLHKNVPDSQQGKVQFLLKTLQRVVGDYIRGQFLLAVIIGLLVGIGMFLFHVPYAVLLGLFAFIFAFVPILGTFVSGAFCVLLALTKGWVLALLVLVYFIVIHVVEGDIVGPRIVGKALGLHPLVSILALIAGTELYGVLGALFAAPVAGVGQAIVVTFWSEWKATHKKSFAKGKKRNKSNHRKEREL